MLVVLILVLGLIGVIAYGALLYQIDKLDKKIKNRNNKEG